MAQDNNTNKFYWLTNEQKEHQIKHLKQRISRWEKQIKQLEERKINSNNRNIRRKKRGPTYEKRISRYTELINVCLKNIKDIEDTM